MASNDENKKYRIQIRLTFAMFVTILLSICSLSRISNRQTKQDQLEQELIEIERNLANYLITSIEGSDNANSYNGMEALSNSYTEIIISEMNDDRKKIKGDLETIGNVIMKGVDIDKYDEDPSSYAYDDVIDWVGFIVILSSNTLFLDFFSNEALLGILLVSCGIIGSGVSAMRSRESTVKEISLVLGAAVGFISLLVVKSGSGIFLMSNLGIEMPFNPYSTALAGIVSGMFSEKLFKFLSTLIDRVTTKKEPPKDPPTPEPSSPQKEPTGK